MQSVLLPLLQLRTPRPAAESTEWGPSGRAVTAPAGVVGRPPLPTQVAQLQAEVARLQSQLAMVSSNQAQSVWLAVVSSLCVVSRNYEVVSQLALVKID